LSSEQNLPINQETEMNNAIEQIIAVSKTQLQALEGMTTHAHAGVEKLVELNLATSKTAIGESFEHLQAVLGAKDAQELMALQSGLTKPLAEKSAAYLQQVQTIATGAGEDLMKAVQANMAETQKALGGLVESLVKNVPAGTESAVAAFKSAMTLGQTAVESAQTSAKKAVEVSQSSLTEASSQAVDATKKVGKVQPAQI
jgi:phasin family protein